MAFEVPPNYTRISFEMSLLDQFEMNDMGNATYVLVIRISRDRNLRLLYLDKEKYLKIYLRGLRRINVNL
jgi:hypothetical protein